MQAPRGACHPDADFQVIYLISKNFNLHSLQVTARSVLYSDDLGRIRQDIHATVSEFNLPHQIFFEQRERR